MSQNNTDRRYSQWATWIFRLIGIAFVPLAAVPPTDAVRGLAMTIVGVGGVAVLAPALVARWFGDESSTPSGRPRRGAWTLVQLGMVVSALVLVIVSSPSWAFKPLLVPLFVVWVAATALYGWQDLVALWRVRRLS
jgi:hypothetical protein